MKTFSQLPSTFHASGRTSIKFHQAFVRPGDLCKLQSNFCAAKSPFVKFPQRRYAFYQPLLTFHTVWRPSVKFCQHSVRPGDLPSTTIKCFTAVGHLATSGNIPCDRETFREFPSTFRSTGRSSINFRQLSVWPAVLLSTFHLAKRSFVNFCQLSVRPGVLPST